MDAARYRTMVVRENAAEPSEIFSPLPEDPEVAWEESWPDWRCGECNQHNDGPRYVCAMCGVVRDDADGLR